MCWGRKWGALFLFWGLLQLPAAAPPTQAQAQAAPQDVGVAARVEGGDAARVTIGTILHNPPYVTENPSAGIDLDIIRAAFGAAGRDVSFTHAPISRVEFLLAEGRIDAMTTFRTSETQCHNSGVFSAWHDGVSVRRDLADRVTSIADLHGLRVGMFPGAERVLDHIIGDHVRTFDRRVTIFRTPLVVRMLRYGRIDAYIGDYWALEHAARAEKGGDEAPAFVTVVAFPPTLRRLCFLDDGLRQIFDSGLLQIRAAGDTDRIIGRYRPAVN